MAVYVAGRYLVGSQVFRGKERFVKCSFPCVVDTIDSLQNVYGSRADGSSKTVLRGNVVFTLLVHIILLDNTTC